MTEKQVIERIRELCRLRNWSYYRLAKESGITYSTLNTMLLKENMPSLSTLSRICLGFGISLSEFFRTEEEPLMLETEEWDCLDLFRTLELPEKEKALSYMEGLRDGKKQFR